MKIKISIPNDYASEADFTAMELELGEGANYEERLAEIVRAAFPEASYLRQTDFGAEWEVCASAEQIRQALPEWAYLGY